MEIVFPQDEQQWLLEKLQIGRDKSFAFNATAHWLRALVIVCEHTNPLDAYKTGALQKVQRDKGMAPERYLRIFEDLFMAAQSISALRDIEQNCSSRTLAATAITTWYYACYNVAKAMLVAKADGARLENHTEVANLWCRTFSINKPIPSPFHLNLPSLSQAVFNKTIAELKNEFSARGKLSETPTDLESAYGCLIAYLSGSEDFYFERKREELLKNADATNFKTKAAQKVRDDWKSKQVIGFMHLAFRLRGKANYRDAIFLSYNHVSASERTIAQLFSDLTVTSTCFFQLGLALCKARVPKDCFAEFVQDIEKNTVLDKSLFRG
ncbi:hypothetical protein N8000_05245 [Rhodospirillales bacterium]|nr:hypothetical protein [Rhodospirillales bacterium]